ncbi:MAG: RagB/SusD family nutrient uptake outer membrane protein, partial [Marinilabiliaceae bacterium]
MSGVIAMMFGMISCEDYLDKSPESTVSSDEAFEDFDNFQGFTEELYYCIPDFSKHYWQSSFNWGDDEIITSGKTWFMGYMVDNGNFWGWQNEHDGWNAGWFDGGPHNTQNDDTHQKNLWPAAWYGIRKANLGLENLDKLKNATQEEKDLIEGQLYFFRGWFHFMMIKYFGGLPYINEVLPSDEQLREPRLSYQEVADSVARDFRRAADLLPNHWDQTTVGQRTSGNNRQRINKIMALGYLGKNYLYAGSPLMNRESQGSDTYNAEYCEKAADAFAELLTLCENDEAPYELVDFEDYSTIFYTLNDGMRVPGGTEAIF